MATLLQAHILVQSTLEISVTSNKQRQHEAKREFWTWWCSASVMNMLPKQELEPALVYEHLTTQTLPAQARLDKLLSGRVNPVPIAND